MVCELHLNKDVKSCIELVDTNDEGIPSRDTEIFYLLEFLCAPVQ